MRGGGTAAAVLQCTWGRKAVCSLRTESWKGDGRCEYGGQEVGRRGEGSGRCVLPCPPTLLGDGYSPVLPLYYVNNLHNLKLITSLICDEFININTTFLHKHKHAYKFAFNN
jgi:hypothetical protein